MAIDQTQMQEYAKQWGQLVARAWSDEVFKQRLLVEPAAALGEQGIAIPPDVEVRVVENTDRVLYLALPPKPAEELSDEQLDAVAAGGASTVGTAGTLSTFISLPTGTVSTIGCAGTAGTAV